MTTRLSFRIHRVMRLNSLWALKSREIFEATTCPPTSASFIIFAQGNTALSLALLYLWIKNCQVPLACCQLRFVKRSVHHCMSWAKPIKWVNHCGKVVTQLLDRHFERKHNLTHAAAKACFRLIKEEESGKKMLKCSLCEKVYKNLSHHLLNSHILKRPSADSTSLGLRQNTLWRTLWTFIVRGLKTQNKLLKT